MGCGASVCVWCAEIRSFFVHDSRCELGLACVQSLDLGLAWNEPMVVTLDFALASYFFFRHERCSGTTRSPRDSWQHCTFSIQSFAIAAGSTTAWWPSSRTMRAGPGHDILPTHRPRSRATFGDSRSCSFQDHPRTQRGAAGRARTTAAEARHRGSWAACCCRRT